MKKTIRPEIIRTEDGSDTLRHPLIGELYHSIRGAEGESDHVFIRAGFDTLDLPTVRILEVGFGSGLNAFLTLVRAQERGIGVVYHAVELYPVDPRTAKEMAFPPADHPFYGDFIRMHDTPWDVPVRINDHFSLKKIHGSLIGTELGAIFDMVYFDAFSPDVQPELWSEKVFAELFRILEKNGILVTYSSKGDVKRALRAAGFEVHRLPGALGKRHMLKAIKKKTDHDSMDQMHHLPAGDRTGPDS